MDQSPDNSIPPASPQAKGALFFLGAALVLGTIGWSVLRHQSQGSALQQDRDARVGLHEAGVPMVLAAVSESSGSRTVRLPGEIRPKQAVTLFAKVPGYLSQMLVDKGDTVEDGQLLGVVESPETEQQLIEAKSNFELKHQLVGRLKGLVGGGVVSAQEMDEAQAQLRSAQADVARITALQGYTRLRAPFAGVITARYADAGAMLPAATSSTGSAQPLVELQDMRRVRIWSYLGQSDAPFVRIGDQVTIASREAAIAPFAATVTRTSRSLEARSRTMLVEVEVDNPQMRLTPGLFVDVQINIHVPSSLQVPSDALLNRGGKVFVARVQDGVAHLVETDIGRDDGRFVAVLKGVNKGDLVGLHVPDDVEEGARIKPIVGKALTVQPAAAPVRAPEAGGGVRGADDTP